MFWENFVRLCNEKGTKPNPVAKELGFASGTLTWWKNGRIPSSSTLHKIADYFGVTVEYLLGKEAPQKEKSPSKKEQGNDIMVGLFGGRDDVPDDVWDKVRDYAKFLMAEEDKKRGKKR